MAIKESAIQLRDLGVDLEQEDDTAGFLGVVLEGDPETSLLEMKQTGLIKRIIEGVVQAWVGQKLLNSNILRVFFYRT